MTSPTRSRWTVFGLLTPLLTGFDLWSKEAAVDALGTASSLPVSAPWLTFVHAENPGAAFSSPIPLPLIVVAGIVGLGLVAHWIWTRPDKGHLAAGLGALVAGGALGNLIDRIGDGTVTDFIRISAADSAWAPWLVQTFGTHTWPIFNLADIWLLVGVAGIVGLQMWEDRSAGQLQPQ